MIIVLVPIFVDILIKQKLKAFTNKNNYLIVLGVIIPMSAYFAYNYALYKDLFSPLIEATGGVSDVFPVFYYLTNAGYIFTIPLFAASLVGISLAFLKPKENSLMLLWLFVVFIVFSSIPRKEERYLLPLVPAVCFFASLPLFLFKKSLGENFDYLLVFALLVFGYFQLSYADNAIKSKADSYYPVKEMSLWLKENTPENSTVITKSKPQVCFYAERQVNPVPDTFEEFNKSAQENDYALISVFEPHSDYAFYLNYTVVAYVPNLAVVYKLR